MHAAKLSALFISILVGGCVHHVVGPPPPVEGFVAFDSPRTFDAPGQVFRKDPQGGVWRVGVIAVTPRSGSEQTLNISTKADWSLQSLLKTAGVAADKISGVAKFELDKVREGDLKSVKGLREYIDDTDRPEDKATELLSKVKYHKDNTYYIIWETLSTKKLEYTSSRKWLADLGLDAQLNTMLASSNHFTLTNENTFSLVSEFDQFMRIWYKAEQLTPKKSLGVGPEEVPSFEHRHVEPARFKIPANVANSP